MYKSTDGGQNFTRLYDYYISNYSDTAPVHPDVRSLQLISSSPNGTADKIIIGCDGGVSKSSDGGLNWANLNGTSNNGGVP